ncbi:hypothetical protein Slin14017_G107050 [Septoria linicola]|nr:hypothetical protein Slin14017_G107050 [Septoria linicola]
MKVTRPGTDQELEFSIYADDDLLQEYALPRATAAAQHTIECFVPVRRGQKLTTRGRFIGTTLTASFDLVVDGSFLAQTRVTDKGSPQYMNRKLTFERVYDCPRAKEGWTSKTHNPLDIYEANIYAEPLQDGTVNLTELETEDIGGERPGVGSIQIVANLQDAVFEHRMDPEWDIEGGGWLHRYKQPARFAGIKPDYAIEVRHLSETPIPQKRSKQHRNHWNVNTRPGFTPWARFIFYYRSQESIEHAGCLPRDDVVHQLEPFTAQQRAASRSAEAGSSNGHGTPEPSSQSDTTSVHNTLLPDVPRFSRLGGDLGAQIRQQSEESARKGVSERSAGHRATEAPFEPVAAYESIGEASSARSGCPSLLTSRQHASQPTQAAVTPSNDEILASDPATQRRNRSEFLNKLTSSKQVKAEASLSSAATAVRTSISSLPNTSPMTCTDEMAKHTQYVSKLPTVAEIIDMIGTEGITQGEAVKVYDDLASEHGFRKPASLYAKVRSEYNARLEKVAEMRGGNKYVLKEEYLARVGEHDDAIATTPQHEKSPPAPMLAPPNSSRLSQAAQAPVSSDRVNMRKRASETPESVTSKKPKSDHSVTMEARRAELEKLKAQTAAILREAEETKARRAAKKAEKAEKARVKEQREIERQKKLEREQEELRMMEEELEAQKAQAEAAKFALEAAEGSDTADDDDEDDENEPKVEMLVGNGEGEVESEED